MTGELYIQFVAHLPVHHHNLGTRCSLRFSCSDTFSPHRGHWIHVTLSNTTMGISMEVYNPCSVVAMDSFAKKHLFSPQTLTFFVHYHFAFCNDISIGGVMLNITSPAFCQWIVITSYRSLGIHQMINSHCNESVTINKLWKH